MNHGESRDKIIKQRCDKVNDCWNKEQKEASPLNTKRRTLIVVNLIVTCVATSFLQTALTTALPPVIQDFHISVSSGQWLTSGYSLVMGIMTPLTAFLITRYPTKKLYLSAIGLFLAGLLVCLFAPVFPVMMVGRVLQACGNGITGSLAQVVLLTVYPPEQRGTIMGWYGLSVGAAPVIAPTIAGVLVDTLGWRAIFAIAFLILLASFLLAVAEFDNVLETQVKSFDLGSFLLSVCAFGGITLGVGNLSAAGLLAPMTLAPLVLGVGTGVWFVRRQLQLAEPFLDVGLLRVHDYALSVVGSMLLYFVMMGTGVILPIYVQSIVGESATVSGLVTLPGSLAMAVVSPFAGKIYDKFGMRRLALVGSVCMMVSCAGMCLIGAQTHLFVAAALNVIRSVAIGCLMMPFVTFGLNGMGAEHTAHGTALLTALRTVSGAIGAAVFVGIMNTASQGQSADFVGLHVAFFAMTAVAVGMFCVMAVGIGKKQRVVEHTGEITGK